MNLIDYIKTLDYKFDVNEFDEELEISLKDWKRPLLFDKSDTVEYFDESINFLNYKFIKNYGCYNENYIEVIITIPNEVFYDFSEVPEMNSWEDKSYYQITYISDELYNNLMVYTFHDGDILKVMKELVSLKIYNVDSVLKDINDSKVTELVKGILFELSYKHDIKLSIEEFPEDFEEYDPFYETVESLNRVQDNFINR